MLQIDHILLLFILLAFPHGLPDHRLMLQFFLPAHPQDHEPSISSTISLPIYELIFISPTSYITSPMGPPPFISFPRNCCPARGTHFTLGHPFLYFVHLSQNLFIIYCTNTFISSSLLLSSPLATFFPFWPHATHVTFGWSITSHSPSPASSISSEYYPGHLPFIL